MKKLLFFVLITLAGISQAHLFSPNECLHTGEMFNLAAQMRDDGIPRTELQNKLNYVRAQNNEVGGKLDDGDMIRWSVWMDEVYARPEWTPEQIQESVYDRCMELWDHQKDLVPPIQLQSYKKVDDKISEDYKPLHLLFLSNGAQLIVQNGQFLCPKDTHRALIILENGIMMVGCALLDGDHLTIVWEAGFKTEIQIKKDKPGHTDGPAKEEQWNPMYQHPKQNT